MVSEVTGKRMVSLLTDMSTRRGERAVAVRDILPGLIVWPVFCCLLDTEPEVKAWLRGPLEETPVTESARVTGIGRPFVRYLTRKLTPNR